MTLLRWAIFGSILLALSACVSKPPKDEFLSDIPPSLASASSFVLVDPSYRCTLPGGTNVPSHRGHIRVDEQGNYLFASSLCDQSQNPMSVADITPLEGGFLGYEGKLYERMESPIDDIGHVSLALCTGMEGIKPILVQFESASLSTIAYLGDFHLPVTVESKHHYVGHQFDLTIDPAGTSAHVGQLKWNREGEPLNSDALQCWISP
jgi:hypothetical protein